MMVPRPLRDLGVESDTLGQGMFRGKVASKRLGYTHCPIRGTKEVKCDAMRCTAGFRLLKLLLGLDHEVVEGRPCW